MASRACVTIILEKQTFLRYQEKLSQAGVAPPEDLPEALEGLARAISASPGWPADCQATLIVRSRPEPALAVVGKFDAAGEAWLRGQARALRHACEHLRYVDYPQVETDCRALAGQLRRHLGTHLELASFVAIPRGGLVVLGLLASLLQLRPEQIGPPSAAESPLVIVDDCALSGIRFRRFLRTVRSESVVFAHLASPRELRDAITRQETRVRACLSAQDLAGVALAEPLPGEPPAGDSYWNGEIEALCFPWSEPDRTVWNPQSRQWDLAWRIVSPEHCLKNGAAPGIEPIAVQIQPEGIGRLRPSHRVLSADLAGQVHLFDLEAGKGFSLEGAGSDIWRALLRHGEPAGVSAELASQYDVPQETLRADTERLLGELLARGLLADRG